MKTYNTHHLKTINPFFKDLWDGKKNVEVRYNDRNFNVGDHLHLLEYDPLLNRFSGKKIVKIVDYILSGFAGLRENYIVMELSKASLNIDYLDSSTENYNPEIFDLECALLVNNPNGRL